MPKRSAFEAGMEVAAVPFEFKGGLVGSPIPATDIGDGCTIFNNHSLGAGGRTLRVRPGSRRVFFQKLRGLISYPLDNTKKIVCLSAQPVIGLPGIITVVVDWTLASPNARILSVGFNPYIPPEMVSPDWNPAVDDFFVLSEFGGKGVTLGRMTAHEYPSQPITFRERTYFYDAYSMPCTLQHGAFRVSTPNKPARKPLLWAAADLLEPCNFLHATDTAFTAVGSNASVAQTAAFPHWDSDNALNYNEITVLTTEAEKNLCYASKYFNVVDAGFPSPPRPDDNVSGWAIEKGRYAYRVTYYVTCYEDPVFSGGGLNDIRLSGTTSLPDDSTIEVEVLASIPSPDTIRFRINAGAWSAAINMDNDNWVVLNDATAGNTNLKARWLAVDGHTVGNKWTISTHYVGETEGGDPSRIENIGSAGVFDAECDLTHIPKGNLGVGGRRLWRTGGGPLIKIRSEDEVKRDGEGNIPIGTQKWVVSYVIPNVGETPHSIIEGDPEITKDKDGRSCYRITDLPLCRTLSQLLPAAAEGDDRDDLLIHGAWNGEQDVDWEVQIVVAVVGAPSTYNVIINGVTDPLGPFAMSGNPAATPASLVAIGFTIEWNDPNLGTRDVADAWTFNRSMNAVIRKIYRQDNAQIGSQLSGSTTTVEFAQADPFKFVGTIDNNFETEFTDNIAPGDLGDNAPSLQELNYYLVTTIEDNETTTYTDHKRMLALTQKLSRIPDAVNHNRVRFPFRYVTDDGDPGRVLEPNSISFFLSGSAVPGDDVKEVPIDVPIQAGIWYYLDLLWPHKGLESRSYGFRQIQRDKTLPAAIDPKFQVGQIYIDRAKWGPGTGKWQARVSYADKEINNETDASLSSVTLNLGDYPSGFQVFPLGYRGFWDTAGNAFADDPVGINLPPTNNGGNITHHDMNVYLFKESWGEEGVDGGGQFRLAANAENPIPTTATPDEYLDLDRSILIGDKDSKFLGEANSYSIGPIAPGETVSEDKSTSQAAQRRRKNKSLALELGGVIGRTKEDTAAIAVQELSISSALHNFRGRAPATSVALLDQDRVIAGPESDFLVGTFDLEKYKDVAKYNAVGISRLYPWMEGREWIINSDDYDYRNPDGQFSTKQRRFVIAQVINPDDPTNTWVRFGSDFNGETLEFREAYYGSTGTKSFKIIGDKSIARYSTNTRRLGANPDYWNEENRIILPFVNDQYVTCGHAGEYLLFFGKYSVFRTLLDRTVTDEAGPIAYPKPEVIHGAPGTIAPRTVVTLPGGRVIWFTTDSRIAIGTASEFQYFEGRDLSRPISKRYEQWLKDNVDPELMKFAKGKYDAARDWYMISFIADDGSDTLAPEGSEYDTAIPDTDFYYRLIIDLRHEIVMVADKFNYPDMMEIGQEFTPNGAASGAIFAGDQYGYLYQLNDEESVTNGLPTVQSVIQFTVTAINVAKTIITIDPASLTTVDDGLKDLEVIVQTSAGEESRKVSSNTASTITFYTALTGDPTLNSSQAYLAPIDYEVRGREYHFQDYSLLTSIQIDAHDPDGSEPMNPTITVYRASGKQIFADGSFTADAQSYTVEDDIENGSGRVWFRCIPSKALMIGQTGRQTAGEPHEWMALTAFIETDANESGRDMKF